MSEKSCFHCGLDCGKRPVTFSGKHFCCNGCKTVYEILNEHMLTPYYDLETAPGKIPEDIRDKYNFLEDGGLAEKLLEFKDGRSTVINLYIPHIHCSSCIWVLEHLDRLNSSIVNSVVNFPKKEVRITFHHNDISLKQVVELLSSIGYEPLISLEDTTAPKKKIDRSLMYKLGVAGFAFGNIMLLSFPEYLQSEEFWLERYKPLFKGLIFVMILPVMLYAARDYFISAYKGLKSGFLNIDVPIVLGMLVLFFRSSYEVYFDVGEGYFDSLSGFVFFLLLGKVFQQQTYSFLSFERDYKSYFPIAVTKINGQAEQNIALYDIAAGDRLLIRNRELIPADGILISSETQIDYSFVTGESMPVSKRSGDKLYAGGRQLHGAVEMEVLHTVEQSYLTQLWSNDVFSSRKSKIKTLTDSISKQFTLIVLLIAFVAGVYWYFYDVSKAAQVITAVLIVACPCALALSAPFALGNILRILGKKKVYLKNTATIEQLAHIDAIIFDKTGTITSNATDITYNGTPMSDDELKMVKSLIRASNHPLSKLLYEHLPESDLLEVTGYEELTGKGISGIIDNKKIKVGSAVFMGVKAETDQTQTYVNVEDKVLGKFTFNNNYRKGLDSVTGALGKTYQLGVLTGDNTGERERLEEIMPENSILKFNQQPQDKLDFIKDLQAKKRNVLMIGDGLNDAGALAQSDVGLAISENSSYFSPASDGILDAEKFTEIPNVMELSKKTLKIIKYSFLLSLMYNFIGMLFAVTGNLSPIVAAILMPLSSISIVIFVTIYTNVVSKKILT